FPGTGVGLAIVKKGMDRIGGRVSVDSSVDRGSCFCLDLRPA
ncbi:MAG: ATP-binding protein, partial [Verrucomicrobiota bacterium]